eukprot:tig00000792_g4195.t1
MRAGALAAVLIALTAAWLLRPAAVPNSSQASCTDPTAGSSSGPNAAPAQQSATSAAPAASTAQGGGSDAREQVELMKSASVPEAAPHASAASPAAAAPAPARPGSSKENETADIFVWWHAPFFSGGGYCSEAIAFAMALDKGDPERGVPAVPVRIAQHGDGFSHAFVEGLSPGVREALGRMARTPLDKRATHRTIVVVCHSEPGAWNPQRFSTAPCPPPELEGRRTIPGARVFRVGRTMFETDRLPDGWEPRLNAMDQVWVPTEFHRRVFAEHGARASKLRVIGEPVDSAFYDPDRVEAAKLPGDAGDYKFLSIFKWEARKGWEVLLEAYFREFTIEEDVTLYLLTAPYHHSGAPFEQQIAEFGRSLGLDEHFLPRVELLRPGVPDDEMPRIYKAADAFVLPSRGEGWGRPHIEAMAMGLPVIATNWSGNTEFMTDENSFPLPIDGLVPVPEGPFKGHLWAQPSVYSLREIMRWVFEHREEARGRGRRARRDVSEKYSLQRLAGALRGLLAEAHAAAWETRPRPAPAKT